MAIDEYFGLEKIADAINALARQKRIENMINFLSTGGLPAMTHAQRTKLETKLIERLLR